MKKLKRPVEELRAQLLADSHTQSIAKKLGCPLEEYVEKVLDYAQNPEKQPEFNVLPDGIAKQQGAATTAEVKQWFEEVLAGKVDLRAEHEKDGFEQGRPVRREAKQDGFEAVPPKKNIP